MRAVHPPIPFGGAPRFRRRLPQWRTLQLSQQWLDERLDNLNALDFKQASLVVASARDLEAPIGFGDVWKKISEVDFEHMPYIMIFVDLQNDVEMSRVVRAFEEIEVYNRNTSPRIVLVNHSDELSKRQLVDIKWDKLAHLVDRGIEIIPAEAKGLQLVLLVRSKFKALKQCAANARSRKSIHYEAKRYQYAIHHIVWTYFRRRLDTGIPEENPSIPAGVPPKIEEATVGSMLGQGASGEVYVLNEPDSRISVLKCIPKALHTRLRGILAIKNEISIMQRFSSKEQRHPNIVGLQQVYLSCSHVFLKMDYGGPETLAQRLNRRDNGTLDCAMPLRDSLSVVSQCVSALYHLHNIAKIAHRDLKTDNIIYAETKIGSQIKVADFGLASCCTDDTVCFKRCGTFVFLAPEVILEESYNACVADVWSMGIVFLEILFFSKFPEAVLFRGCRGLSDEQAMEKVRSRLGASESLRVLIQTYLRPEYRGNGASGYRMLLGMLNVVAGDRSKASEAFSSCAEFVAQVGKSDEMKTDIIQGDYEANLSMCDVF